MNAVCDFDRNGMGITINVIAKRNIYEENHIFVQIQINSFMIQQMEILKVTKKSEHSDIKTLK